MQDFSVAGGSVCGKDHLLTDKPNQDAYHIVDRPDWMVGVVCDGCGSGKYSGIGSTLASRFIAEALSKSVELGTFNPGIAHIQLTEHITEFLHQLAYNLVGVTRPPIAAFDLKKMTLLLDDYALFTVVGFVLAPPFYCTFYAGDGFIRVNLDDHPLLPESGNRPNYVGYRVPHVWNNDRVNANRFVINRHKIDDLACLDVLLIGTDGISDLISSAEKKIPGKEELVGPLSQFYTDPLYFKNPDAIRRRLSLINKKVVRPNWELKKMEVFHGHLSDDTSLIVVRRNTVD
jgi:serine/threonine protein phosphatase PrpC